MSTIGPTAAADLQLVPSCDYSVDTPLSGGDVDLTQVFNAGYARELYFGTAGGTVKVLMKDSGGTTCTYTVQQYQTLSGKFIKVYQSGTTATGIVARY